MSRMRFLGILLGALIALIVACLIVSLLANWRQIGDLPIFALMFVVLLGAAGLIPFCLRLLIQGIFRKRMIPGYVPWLISSVLVILQLLFPTKSPPVPFLYLLSQSILTFLIIGSFTDAGMHAVRAKGKGGIKSNEYT